MSMKAYTRWTASIEDSLLPTIYLNPADLNQGLVQENMLLESKKSLQAAELSRPKKFDKNCKGLDSTYGSFDVPWGLKTVRVTKKLQVADKFVYYTVRLFKVHGVTGFVRWCDHPDQGMMIKSATYHIFAGHYPVSPRRCHHKIS